MAVSSLDALGVAPEDMTPAEAKELARLMEQVRALEEGTSTTQRRETPALFAAEEKPQRTRKLQRPKSARARYPSKTLARSAKDFAKKQQAFRATELREKAEDKRNKGNASPVKEEHDDVPAPPSEPPKDVVTRVVLWPEYALLRDGDVRVHVGGITARRLEVHRRGARGRGGSSSRRPNERDGACH